MLEEASSFSAPSVRALIAVIGLCQLILTSVVTAQCADPPVPLPNDVIECRVSGSGDGAGEATVGIDDDGRYVIGWSLPRVGDGQDVAV